MISYIKHRVEWILCQSFAGKIISRILGDWIRSPGVPRGFPAVSVLAPRDRVSDATRASLFWGFHEAQEIRYAEKYLTSNLDVIDLGASLGAVSSHIAQKLGHGHRLVCVEANPALAPNLRKTILRNAPDAQCEVIHAAIGYGSESVRLVIGDDITTSHVGGIGTSVSVSALSLSKVLEQSGVEEFALVCDIEGAEAAILEQDLQSLAHCRMIIMELHASAAASVYQMRERIEATGFTTRAQHGAVFVFSRP